MGPRKDRLPKVHQDEGVLPQVGRAEQVYERGAQLLSDILLERQHLGESQAVSRIQAATVSRSRHQSPSPTPDSHPEVAHHTHQPEELQRAPASPGKSHRQALSHKPDPAFSEGTNPLRVSHLQVGRRQLPILLGDVVHDLYRLSVSLLR